MFIHQIDGLYCCADSAIVAEDKAAPVIAKMLLQETGVLDGSDGRGRGILRRFPHGGQVLAFQAPLSRVEVCNPTG